MGLGNGRCLEDLHDLLYLPVPKRPGTNSRPGVSSRCYAMIDWFVPFLKSTDPEADDLKPDCSGRCRRFPMER